MNTLVYYLNWQNTLTKKIALVLSGVCLLTLGSKVSFSLGLVPFTMQEVSLYFIALAYGRKLGLITLFSFFGTGLFFPVFAGSQVGMPVFFGPTGGYLLGFVAVVWIMGTASENRKDRTIMQLFPYFAMSLFSLYAFGLLGLSFFIGFGKNLLEQGFYPFIFAGICKALLTLPFLPIVWKKLKK